MSGLVVGLGEAMLRLTPEDLAPLARATRLEVSVGGAELNALVAAAQLGCPGRFLTALPPGALAERVSVAARGAGVEVVAASVPSARLGLYFLERGLPPRPTAVTYDRAGSAASTLSATSLDWATHLASARAALVSGITPRLGEGPRSAVAAFLDEAGRVGALRVLDPNVRRSLGTPEEWAKDLSAVLDLVDLVMLTPADLALLLGEGDPRAQGEELARRHGVEVVLREVEGDDQYREVTVTDLESGAAVRTAARVLDELGAGDAALGALVAARLDGADPHVQVRRAALAYARTLTLPGDWFVGSLADLEESAGPGVSR